MEREGVAIPTVVPAECIVYLSPLALRTRCTSATSSATEIFPVPTYGNKKERVSQKGQSGSDARP